MKIKNNGKLEQIILTMFNKYYIQNSIYILN